jgi:hypothetical protein
MRENRGGATHKYPRRTILLPESNLWSAICSWFLYTLPPDVGIFAGQATGKTGGHKRLN